MNDERKLASVQRVWSVEPIHGADFVELASVMGWRCVAKKGEFAKGDLCVYFEVDSVLPVTDERFAFLEKSSLKNIPFLGPGYLIKTRKFRGQFSQGLALPLDVFPEITDPSVGLDVTELLGVRQWVEPEVMGSLGVLDGDRPWFVPKTDELRIQSAPELREYLVGLPYYITTKMDGTSVSVWCRDGEIGVTGRNKSYKRTVGSPLWQLVEELGLPESLPRLDATVVIQGELCGPKIQRNRLKLARLEWYVFNVLIDGELQSLDAMTDLCSRLGLETVPVEETGESFDYTLEALLERAMGLYPSGQQKEGIVVRPLTPTYDADLRKSLSFKVLNNEFLLE